MRLAFLADIHGNLPALEAVAGDLALQAPDAVYLVGDQVNRCPWPNEVLDLLAAQGWPAIYGNHDYVVARIGTPESFPPFTERPRFACLWWSAETLRPSHRRALHDLPAELAIDLPDGPSIRLFHGVPGDPFLGILPEAGADSIARRLHGVAEPVVVCGHTHRPLARQVGRWRIFNGGSVGMPYNEDPRAQYLILDAVHGRGASTWRPTFRQVDYDHSLLRPAFEQSSMWPATGAMGELYLRTVLTGHAYGSDFGYWLKSQPRELQIEPDRAVPIYLASHGPGRWAFNLAGG